MFIALLFVFNLSSLSIIYQTGIGKIKISQQNTERHKIYQFLKSMKHYAREPSPNQIAKHKLDELMHSCNKHQTSSSIVKPNK